MQKQNYRPPHLHTLRNTYRTSGDYAYINLRRRDGTTLETKIDIQDLHKASSIKGTWSPSYDSRMNTFYVMTKVDGKTVFLHRFILDAKPGTDVDHKNHDTLNNTRKNIVVCSHADNMKNCQPHKNNTSGVPGISYDKSRNKYEAYRWENGKKKHLGRRNTLREAEELLHGF